MQLAVSQPQIFVNALKLGLGLLVLLIVSHLVVDLFRYIAFRVKFQQTFIPRSWLFFTITALWTLLISTRDHAVATAPNVSIDEVKDSEKLSQTGKINSLFTCSVVVGGLLLEISRLRARYLCRLEAGSRLAHPSAKSIIFEQGLRAVHSSDSEALGKLSQVFMKANSDAPIFVPCGMHDSQLVFVDLGRNSLLSIVSENDSDRQKVFNGLLISTLFASTRSLQVVVYGNSPLDSDRLGNIWSADSATELAGLVEASDLSCVIFCRQTLDSHEIDQLLEMGVAVVCQHRVANATLAIESSLSGWCLSPEDFQFIPYGLSVSQLEAVSELLRDVVRSSSTIETNSNSLETKSVGADEYKVLVRTLGPVEVQLADGTVIEFEKSKTTELLAWLTSHRARPTRSAARTALWEFTVADATFSNVVSDIRRTLNQTELLSSFEEWIPRTFNDLLPFHSSIISDGELLQACIERSKGLSPDLAVVELRRGLQLVRDLPFAGTGYLWPDAEGITSQLVMTVIRAATMAAEIDLQRGEIEGVFWATAQGLKVLGAHEELFALRMRAHASRGNLAGVRFEFESYMRAVNSDSFLTHEPSKKLTCLMSSLISEKPVALAR